MDRRQFLKASTLLLASKKLAPLYGMSEATKSSQLWMEEFANPPNSVYPWVYSFWMEGNITREGITADLEGMQQAGIRGLLLMAGDLGNPLGPHRFMSESWLEMFDHLLAEGERLGIEVNLNNDPGWSGSSGPWVKPEQASQKIIMTETMIDGPIHFDGSLPQFADVNHNYYQDITVLAYPLDPGQNLPSYRIPDYSSTKSFAGGHDFAGVVPWPRFIPTNPEWPIVAQDQCIVAEKMVDLSTSWDGEKLNWHVPEGRWIVFRIGHTVANGGGRSAPAEARGLECDKMSKSALDAHFEAMVGKLAERAGPRLGKVLVSTHIDSWEAGSGNWTDGFREEFQRLNGYDLLPYFPVLDGIVVDDREISERFLWDYRETVSKLVLENYAAHMRNLAHNKGLRLSIEGYDGTCDDLRFAGRADEQMTEFWRSCYSGLPLSDLSESMTSAAHVYGRSIVNAEAFTSMRGDFIDHPATLKPLADWAFCTGINHFYFSEWVMQPWPNLVPGLSFGTFGTVFHRSLTWWPQSRPWHEYIARCQYMLRQGQFVADICFIAPEGAPYRFTLPIQASERVGTPDRPAYNSDGCPAELVLEQMKVESGNVVLPSGMSYRVLVLPTYRAPGQSVIELMTQDDYFYKPEIMPQVRTMTPELLEKIRILVEAGATVLGYRPVKSPSLIDFHHCDEKVSQLSDELWGTNAGFSGAGERHVGKGRVVWGSTPERLLQDMGIPKDFEIEPSLQGRVNYTHRRTTEGSDIYFIVNKQQTVLEGVGQFRVSGKHPELYWPQTGRIEPALAFEESNGVIHIPLSLNANESVFVVFRETSSKLNRLIAVSHDGKAVWPRLNNNATEDFDDSFIMAAWITPGPDLVLPVEQDGYWVYSHKPLTAGLGYQTMASPGQGRGGFSIGKNGIVVFQYGESGEVNPLLVHAAEFSQPVLVGVLYKHQIPRLFLNGKLVKTGPKNRTPWTKGNQWVDRRPFAGEIAALHQFEQMLVAAGIESLDRPDPQALPTIDFLRRRIWKSGAYHIKGPDGIDRTFDVQLPPATEITGPWEVEFEPRWGGPSKVIFDKLTSWPEHSINGIRYYSGKAIYRNTFHFDASAANVRERMIYLDLGKVANLARVKLNGKNLGILWNAPYRIDITDAVGNGRNRLELEVVNVWVNRLIGDESLPPDSERDADGQVVKWPDWLLQGKSSPSGRFTFTSHRQWNKDSPLLQSGLLGPVRLMVAQRLYLPEAS